MTQNRMVQLGDYIVQSEERNSDGSFGVDSVRGLSTGKEVIETKANMEGVSLLSYKILRPYYFAYVPDTSRRGDKISLGFNDSNDSYIVSSISCVFKVKDDSILDPAFLFVFFCRPEFDRLARFNSWGSAREAFNFEDMCRVVIPLPSIEQQRAIAQLYYSVKESRRISEKMEAEFNTLWPALIQKVSND